MLSLFHTWITKWQIFIAVLGWTMLAVLSALLFASPMTKDFYVLIYIFWALILYIGLVFSRLREVGPRLTLQLVKIEDGLCDGTVLFHEFVHKSLEEQESLMAMRERKRWYFCSERMLTFFLTFDTTTSSNIYLMILKKITIFKILQEN